MLRTGSADSYLPIRDYGIIGDCHSAALISNRGAIDWLCWPRFDSPSLFGGIVDAQKGGWFRISPVDDFSFEQRYIDGTNVLETLFRTGNGQLVLTDLMPVAYPRDRKSGLQPERELLRKIECTEGSVEIQVDYTPGPNYGDSVNMRLIGRGMLGLFCEHGGGAFNLLTDFPLQLSSDRRSGRGRFQLERGDRRYFSIAFSYREPLVIAPLGAQAETRITHTTAWWRDWASACCYSGPYRKEVLRSALVLKLMTFAPSGAVVAAPTSSLPEWIGSERNWDYRFCWLRDASMTLRALSRLGYKEESASFLSWLIHTTALTRPELQVVYDVYGGTRLTEQTLDYLEGYAGSRPVRIGNGASKQLQLDIYGEVADGAYGFVRRGDKLDRASARMLRGIGEVVCRRWRDPDEGIWEIRSGRRHHTFSKVMCWVALDRLLKLHGAGVIQVPAQRFAQERDMIRAAVENAGYNSTLQSYTSSFGSDEVDASLLLLPLFKYMDAGHPRMQSTFRHVRERLGRNGLLFRYTSNLADGLPPGEGAFVIGSFWAIECLIRQGNRGAARAELEHMFSHANHLGLFPEEIDPQSGAFLGNFPQAYTHVGLINAAVSLLDAR